MYLEEFAVPRTLNDFGLINHDTLDILKWQSFMFYMKLTVHDYYLSMKNWTTYNCSLHISRSRINMCVWHMQSTLLAKWIILIDVSIIDLIILHWKNSISVNLQETFNKNTAMVCIYLNMHADPEWQTHLHLVFECADLVTMIDENIHLYGGIF